MALQAMGEQAWLLHDQPDAGMWELRTRARVHVPRPRAGGVRPPGQDRRPRPAIRIGPSSGIRAPRRSGARIVEQSWNEKRQSFVDRWQRARRDAPLMVGFCRLWIRAFAARARSATGHGATKLPIGRPKARSTSARSGASTPCAHRPAGSGASCSTLLARRNHVGLLSEDMSTATGVWGKTSPSTYSMVGIINGAVRRDTV